MIYLIVDVESDKGHHLSLVPVTDENRHHIGMVHIDTVIEATDEEDAKVKAKARITEINEKIKKEMEEMQKRPPGGILVPRGAGGLIAPDGTPVKSSPNASPEAKQPELPN